MVQVTLGAAVFVAAALVAALVAAAVWWLGRAGFPNEEGRGPWRTLLDLLAVPWGLCRLLCGWVARHCGADWSWTPVGCPACWWLGRLGQTSCHDGLFWCPRCHQEV